MVVGGTALPIVPLFSTEILVEGAESWTVTADLPIAPAGNRAVALNNIVYSTGERVGESAEDSTSEGIFAGGYYEDATGSYRDDIWQWDDDRQEWVWTKKMVQTRGFHAVSVVTMTDDIMNYCD